MYQDPIPPKDADFNDWVLAFAGYLNTAHNPALGVTDDQLLALAAAVAAWTHAYGATTNPATVTSTDVAAKNEARAALEAICRPIIRLLQASPVMTNDIRTSLGLHIPSGTRARAAVPTTAPQLTIRNGLHLEHLVDIRDSASPHSKAQPAGLKGCKLYCKVGGTAPVDASDMTPVELVTKSPYAMHFTGVQAGLVAYYRACWENTHNELGPWSDLASATIPG